MASRRRPPAQPRRPGRPAGETVDQRGALLDAALALYARDGIAATNLRRIAAQAGVTPAMVGYYFGAKEGLVDAVVEERILPVIQTLVPHVRQAGDTSVVALVDAFVRGMHRTVASNPWLPTLWVREILTEGGALRAVLLDRIAPQLPLLMAERFAAAQARGALNPTLDPRLLVVSLIGLTLFPLAAEPIWRRLFDAGDVDADTLARHTTALLVRGLEADHAR